MNIFVFIYYFYTKQNSKNNENKNQVINIREIIEIYKKVHFHKKNKILKIFL
jgi:hypothetical protein